MAMEKHPDKTVSYPDKDKRLLNGIKSADIDRVREALSHGANPKRSPYSTAKNVLDEVRVAYNATSDLETRAKLKVIEGLVHDAQMLRLAKMAIAPVILPSRGMFKAPGKS